MIVWEECPVSADEIEQVRHLLKIRRHPRVVAPQMGIIELYVNDVLNGPASQTESTGISRGLCSDCGIAAQYAPVRETGPIGPL
jgi:hypothetical protein